MRYLATLLFTAVLFGQAPVRPVVLKAARLFDGKSETLISPAMILVQGDRIQAVGSSIAVPPNANVIDLGDATLMPGFMDAHTHLTFEYPVDFNQTELDGLKLTVAEKTLRRLPDVKATLLSGFTTVRDVGAADFMDVGIRNAINRKLIVGPRMLVAVNAIGTTGGHCDNLAGFRFNLFGRESGIPDGAADGPYEFRKAVRYAVKYGADVIKTCATGGVLSPTDEVDTPQLTQEELNALVDEAHALKKKAAAHAHGAEGAKRAIRAGIDSIEHGSFLDNEALDMMKQRGTVLVPTLMAIKGLRERIHAGMYLPPAMKSKAEAAMAGIENAVRNAVARNVKIGLGTDTSVYAYPRAAEEFGELVRYGVKPIDALRAGTSVDAELFGLGDRLGMLEQGKIADIVAVPGNPISDVRVTERVFFVMKEGEVFRNDRH
ncbi:MAG: amidohydrolase family protein [Bryobacteraceae bacterium]